MHKLANRCFDQLKGGNAGKVGDHRFGDPINVAQALADLDVAAFVEILDRDRESAKWFAPQFVNAFLAAAVQNKAAKLHRIEQALATFAHQGIVATDFNAIGL